MKRKPLKVLVCLGIVAMLAIGASAWAYNGTGAPMAPGIQGEALSADPTVQAVPPLRSQEKHYTPHHRKTTEPSSSGSSYKHRRSGSTSESIFAPSYPARRSTTTRSVFSHSSTAVTPALPPVTWPVKASATGSAFAGACARTSSCGPSLGYSPCVPILPRIGCKQFGIEARVWYASLNSSTVQWGTIPGGYLSTELDLVTNLGLRRHEYVGEYIARCQFRSNWGVRYTFLPLHYRDNFTNWVPFWYGNVLWPVGQMLTQWDRNIHTWELVYSWFQAPHAVSSVFAGYRLVDDKLSVSYPLLAGAGYTRIRSEDAHLATAGISLDKVITRLGGCATASMHCQWSIQFLESYLGWDGYAAGRVSVPMGRGRFGYMEAGWKWLVLERSQPSNIDKTSLDGVIASAGLVF